MSLLEVRNLRIEYPSRHGIHAAVKALSFNIERGEIVGVVGESGAGKSTVGNAVIDLLSLQAPLPMVKCFLMAKRSLA
ncbi:dipeptide transport ATP-binding protein DppD [Vibrio astriarenae]|nr:dipeptide transport ATP-binding protein DppD [Vibrio sp. C7]